ncbi:hypothetical protein ACW4EZ_30240 (plasmid) [Bacillus toyonensis]|uniref:hypothetical protein n=1 Tax=Bacillus TaxID=1386 RepID=UPI000BFC9913|nr:MULTISPECIES: hypothetical protein [Bacillus]AXK21608.1 hypothetical protein DPQ31_29565 [Bacillus sp. COPE52]MED2868791.1 hypothetical protein [Bacillus thuringiensis]PHB54283.1 hypothetical protein COE91_11645 [Bacillus toyonensis]HDX9658608.1 hypothetical protein [Bacillus toyonensis]
MVLKKIKEAAPKLTFGKDVAVSLYGGDGLGTSLAKASIKGVLKASNPVLYGVVGWGSLAQKGYWGLLEFNHQREQWWKAQYATSNVVGGNFLDTRGAQTMRQAAVQAIQGSKMNARSALGGEAKILSPY